MSSWADCSTSLAAARSSDQTWVIITADHGESFGEHAGVFCHGTSLYQTELHVPLVIIPPGGSPSKRVVTETVSLRNLAATIVDVLDLEAGSPFPGESLARFWDGSSSSPSPAADRALSEVVPIDRSIRTQWRWSSRIGRSPP